MKDYYNFDQTIREAISRFMTAEPSFGEFRTIRDPHYGFTHFVATLRDDQLALQKVAGEFLEMLATLAREDAERWPTTDQKRSE